jgi:AbiU2
MAKPKNPCEMLERVGNELMLLWTLLDTYQELFLVEQDKRAGLLAQTAPGFFAVVQLSLIESILMRIFRLMDEANMGQSANCSFETLRRLLAKQPLGQRKNRNVFRLRLCLRQLRKDWRVAAGSYAGLKKIRNKDLAHNDYTQHSRRSKGQLWMALTLEEFERARSLGARLWALYRQAKLAICHVHVVEPIPSRLDDRPPMVLKHLCSSLFLDQLLEGECYQHLGAEQTFELEHMGNDRIRQVFEGKQK